MAPFVKTLFGQVILLAILGLFQLTAFASVDDAQTFALQAAEPYVKQGFQVREDYWGGDLGSGEKKQCVSNCLKGMNTGFGWAQKSNGQKFPCIFMTRMGNWQKSRMDGRKVTSRLRTLFRKLRAVTSSL